jgi:uncharacterized protein (TIGR00661 family)
MKILYGVQGTGNGHITRARIMARALADVGAEVDWVFSGRAREAFFDMDVFGDFRSFRGLTFVIKSGRVHYGKTLLSCNFQQLYRDIRSLNMSGYDLIINDFEPVSAWAARRASKKVIGLSHQNAFRHQIPKKGSNPLVSSFMRWFAPADLPIGLHWHHFDQPILPPLVEPSHYPNEPRAGHYLVYLPFSEAEDILPQLRDFTDHHFWVYLPISDARNEGNLHLRPFSRDTFQQDLHQCEGVICSAGFELPSEAIQLGKKLLVQPVAGQMEQLSNALALTRLGYGQTTGTLSKEVIGEWLQLPRPRPVLYPNVAKAIAEWLVNTGGDDMGPLLESLWHEMPEDC